MDVLVLVVVDSTAEKRTVDRLGAQSAMPERLQIGHLATLILNSVEHLLVERYLPEASEHALRVLPMMWWYLLIVPSSSGVVALLCPLLESPAPTGLEIREGHRLEH